MTFDDVLTQVLELLQREQRVSYRALKLRFDLNDDYIEGMKDELIYAKKLAVDEENRVLVWIGNGAGTVVTSSPPPQSIPSPLPQETPPVHRESPLATSRLPEAERRQLTVMFCDLADSTRLSSQLDPEDLREVIRAYQHVCSEVITRFDGHIAQLLGDGLLVYFGYPQAHEDDAHRAIRTGLGLLEAMGDLNTRLQQAQGLQLAIRIGIHTGLVVWYELELYRLKGELVLQQSLDNQAEAETCFHHALDIARNQQAKSWELRAATSLARLWQSQGKRNAARQVLGDVYSWFTEGFDTADLQDAKALLEALA